MKRAFVVAVALALAGCHEHARDEALCLAFEAEEDPETGEAAVELGAVGPVGGCVDEESDEGGDEEPAGALVQ